MSFFKLFRTTVCLLAVTILFQASAHADRLKSTPITPNAQILETELDDGSNVMCFASESIIMAGNYSGDKKSFISAIDIFEKEKSEISGKQKLLKKKRRKLRRKIKRGSFKRRRKRKMRTKVKGFSAEIKSLTSYVENQELKMLAENEACTVRVLSPYSGRSQSAAFYKKTITRDEARHLLRKLALNDISFIEDGASEYDLETLLNNVLNPNIFSKDLKQTLEYFRDGIGANMRAVLPWTLDGKYLYVFDRDESFNTIAQQRQGLRTLSEVYPKGYNPNIQVLHYGNSFTSPIYLIYGRYLSSIQAKMSHLWFGHFGTSWTKPEAQNDREYFDLIYDNSVGSFREMVLGTSDDACLNNEPGSGILCDVSSSIWLDHHLNTKEDRNQNFAREIMELYLLGPNDKLTGEPNYTEVDVVASTAFTSGFKLSSRNIPIGPFDGLRKGATTVKEYYLQYEPERHDNLPWAAFQGTDYQFRGPATPTQFIAHIFDHHPGMPRFIADKLFRMIAHQNPSDALITSLAATFKASNFNISALLYAIASSEAMFSDASYERNCIKSPVEQYLELSRNLQLPLLSTVSLRLTNSHHNWGGVINRLRGASNLPGVNALLNQAGEKTLLYDTVFTYDYCGRNAEARGYDWLDSTRLLYRTKNMIELVGLAESYNHYTFNYYRIAPLMAQYLNKNVVTLTPEDFVKFFEVIYDVDLARNEEQIILRYLNQSMNSEGQLSNITWDMNNTILIKEKIAGLAAIFLDMSITNVK